MDGPVPSYYDLLHITRAYNRAEISFEEWLQLTREWAERIIRQAAEREQGRVNVEPISRRPDEVR